MMGLFEEKRIKSKVSAKNITKNPHVGKKTMDEETLREMEVYAKELGVSSLGYTKVNPIFKNLATFGKVFVIMNIKVVGVKYIITKE